MPPKRSHRAELQTYYTAEVHNNNESMIEAIQFVIFLLIDRMEYSSQDTRIGSLAYFST